MRLRALSSFTFIGILLSSSPLLAITADEIVAKNVEARGGAAALAAVKSLRRTGRYVRPGSSTLVTVSQVVERPGRVREETTYQGLTEVEAFDGAKAWRVDPFEGRKEPAFMSADDAKPLRLAADLDGPWVDAKAKGHALEYLGTEDVDGTLAHKVRVTLAWGGEITVFFDPDTWMAIRERRKTTVRGAERERETDLGDYEKVGGVFVPMSEETGPKGSASASRGKVVWEKGEANVAVPKHAFAFPASAAKGEGR